MGAPYSEATHLIVRGIHHCERIRVGDFVLFEGAGGWIAHRIIWVLPGSRYVTKGDANLAFDRPYPSRDRLLGKVVGYVINDLDHARAPDDDAPPPERARAVANGEHALRTDWRLAVVGIRKSGQLGH